MKDAAARPATRNGKINEASTRPAVILGMLVLVALVFGFSWFRSAPRPASVRPAAAPTSSAAPGLSEATLAVLQRLNAPVEIRFYSVLNDSEAAAPRREYAGRIAGLLAEYERAGEGRISVKRFDSATGSSPAATDGLEPLRLGRDLNYLGLAVVCAGQKAVMASLAPEWEAALEFDLSRAIARVAGGAPPAGQVVMNPPPADAVSTDELLAAVPEVETLPLVEATQKVKAAGLEEFKTAAAEIQAQLAAAHQRLAEAQKAGPESEQAARKELHQLQAEQDDRLAEISRRMQGRLAALQQLKRSAP